MTPVLIGKGLLFEGSNPKIEDKQVPGIHNPTIRKGPFFHCDSSEREETSGEFLRRKPLPRNCPYAKKHHQDDINYTCLVYTCYSFWVLPTHCKGGYIKG